MNFGCCVSTLNDVPALEAAGGDYYELPIARTLMSDAGEEGFVRLIAQARRLRLRPRAYNVFLPPDLPVVGPAVDHKEVDHYAQLAFDRVRLLGGSIVVFGSGRSRSIPAAFSRPAALDQLEDMLRSIAGIAARSSIILALEPLRRSETNVLNTLSEAAAFIRSRELSGVRLIADLYHMKEEGEPFAALDECAELLVHVHVADSGRQPPGPGGYDLTGFLRHLRDGDYRGDCSIECQWADFPRQISTSLTYVREAAEGAGWR
jgi:sugar phosphate isomerase/epimerase